MRRQRIRFLTPGLNMAPMIDIVFLLLVFFMCTSSFNENEGQLPAQMPQTSLEAHRLIEDFDPVRIALRKTASGVEVQCDGQPCASFDVLLAKLAARRAIADTPVIIEGQKGVPFGPMVAAMDTCYRANCRQVAFSIRGISDAVR